MNHIGNNILKFREERGLSQEELGNLCGVSRVAVSNWERGSSIPRQKTLAKIANALDVAIDEITGTSEPETPASNLSRVLEKYGDPAVDEVNELFARTAGLFAGGKLSQKAKDAYFAAITQAYLDCRNAAEDEKSTD